MPRPFLNRHKSSLRPIPPNESRMDPSRWTCFWAIAMPANAGQRSILRRVINGAIPPTSIDPAVTVTIEELTDFFSKCGALRSQGAALRIPRQGLDAVPSASDPTTGRVWSSFPDVAVDAGQVLNGRGCDDNPVSHRPGRASISSSSKTASTSRPKPFLAWARPRRIPSIAAD